MSAEWLVERFVGEYGERPAMVWRDKPFSYGWLQEKAASFSGQLEQADLKRRIIALEGDYAPDTIAALFALLMADNIVILLEPKLPAPQKEEYLNIAEASACIHLVNGQISYIVRGLRTVHHPLLSSLLQEGAAGLVLFSSGSTGKSKAVVHHADRLLSKFQRAGRSHRLIPFMLFDHIGGLNTLLQSLASGGCLYIAEDRSPDAVCSMIERYRIEALPTSPTFMRLLLLSGAYKDYDMSSLRIVSYGSEVMPQHTLELWNQQFPGVRTIQAYGMSELGVLRTRSASSDSLSFSLAEGEAQYRIVDRMLELKSDTAMLGYLNAPSPFTADGWLRTGDEAVLEGNSIRILGRCSEMINVGGEKVYPAEVENVLQQMDVISEVAVSGEPSGITGQLVKATVRLHKEMSLRELRGLIRSYCMERLPAYKIPQKVVVTTESLTSSRMKKIRKWN
ncbi:long-chain fatty acid--CoA ligase [Paenibacillus sp. HB172176]|uniref:long-chain fatty acid--CoA ligase n=1 Tax=Paenibacillus sp. HB172176 TaxID=2493690 RepID=UPI00143AE860|nr:long-chain fatty acid--CoA ligase [Paenibacillus sp. HB172176]